MFRSKQIATVIALAVTAAIGPAFDALAASGMSAMTCTNPASGASWQITIDYDRSTVDSYPARIGADEISWHDAKAGGNYTLDRKSGKLTFVAPSSTGGYFLHDHCAPAHSD